MKGLQAIGVVGVGVVTFALAGALATRGVIEEWILLVIVAGGSYGALIGVLDSFETGDGTRAYLLRFTVVFLPFPVLLSYSADVLATFWVGAGLVIFGLLLEDVAGADEASTDTVRT